MISIPISEVLNNLNEFSWKILKLLNENQTQSFLDIRKELELSQEKSYKEIARLEGALLITSKRDLRDQRSILYSLTDYGKAAIKLDLN